MATIYGMGVLAAGMAAMEDAGSITAEPGVCSATNDDEFSGDSTTSEAPDAGMAPQGSGLLTAPAADVDLPAFVSSVAGELRAYGEAHELDKLEDRTKCGLDPAGMLAVAETRGLVRELAAMLIGSSNTEEIDAVMTALTKFTNEMHVGAVWQYADDLAALTTPEAKLWLIMGDIMGTRWMLQRFTRIIKMSPAI